MQRLSKKKLFGTIFIILIVVVVGGYFAAQSFKAGDAESAPTRAAIARVWRDHIAAAQRKDLDGVVAMYTDDAVYFVAGAPEVRGRAAIRAMEAAGLSSADVVAAEHTTEALRVHGDVAHEIGMVRGPVSVQGAELRVMTFHYLAWWARGADGAWRVRYLLGRS